MTRRAYPSTSVTSAKNWRKPLHRPRYLRTEWGIGYRFADAAVKADSPLTASGAPTASPTTSG